MPEPTKTLILLVSESDEPRREPNVAVHTISAPVVSLAFLAPSGPRSEPELASVHRLSGSNVENVGSGSRMRSWYGDAMLAAHPVWTEAICAISDVRAFLHPTA